MSVSKKNPIKSYSLYLSRESIVWFSLLPGHLSGALAQDYKQKGHDPSRSGETRPNQTNPPSPSPAHFSLATLWRGERASAARSK